MAPFSTRQKFGSQSQPFRDLPSKMGWKPVSSIAGIIGPRPAPRPALAAGVCCGGECGGCERDCGGREVRASDHFASCGSPTLTQLRLRRRLEHGIGHVVGEQRVAERGRRTLAFTGGREEIGGLMDEGVFVADLQPGHPPVLHVRMVAIGDVDAAPAAQAAFVAMIEILQAMQVVQVPD